MTELTAEKIQMSFYDERGISIAPDTEPLFEGLEDEAEGIAELYSEVIDELFVPKPEWFRAAEKQARAFLGSLAFHDLADIYLVKQGESLQQVSGFDVPTAVGVADPFTNTVIFREDRLAEIYAKKGITEIAGATVHELAHTTAAPMSRVGVQKMSDTDLAYNFRDGFGVANYRQEYGSFYEEGYAQWMNGLFKRRQVEPEAPLVGTQGYPKSVTPDYLAAPKKSMTSGPDAHSMELIAWGLEQRGIMSAAEFATNLLASRRPETQLQALRTHAQAVDALGPGLYKHLRDLEYGKATWRQARDHVHSIVTHSDQNSAEKVA